jgi:hypothetical protein
MVIMEPQCSHSTLYPIKSPNILNYQQTIHCQFLLLEYPAKVNFSYHRIFIV